MATFYISPTGNDTNNGSQASPWKTLFKATSTVTSGNTIFVNAGTYTETQQCDLAVGVNLEGANRATTILKCSKSGDWSTFLSLESGGVTNGNQTIKNLTFDGQYVSESNFKTWTGIWNTFRNNVVIDNCEIKNFYDRGVIFNGNGDNSSTIPVDPGIYTTGNKVINCIFNNTSRNSPNYIAGQLNFGGQKDMEISGNTMIQTQRPAGKNGEILKYWGSGYNLGCKILNNTLKRLNFSSGSYNGSGDWNFAIELFNQSGMEIAGNTIQGSIDLNYNRKGVYPYSVWIHDNVSDHNPINTKEENGIVFEFETQDVIVENNKFLNQAIGITFNMRTPSNNGGYNNPMPVGGYSACNNIIIRNNLFANLYSAYSYGNCCGSAGIQFYTEGDTKDAYVRNLLIENNTFVNRTGNESNNGIDLTHFINGATPRADGITISKNIFVGFTDTYLVGGGSKMTNIATRDNDIWQCGSNNAPQWTGTLVNTGNISVNPNFDTNYISTLPIGYKGTGTANQSPISNAGPDQSIVSPTSVTLSGSGTDPDGTIVSYLWTKVSGPSSGTITTPSAATTTVTGLGQGTYIFRLTVTDNNGGTGFDDVSIVVTVAPVNTNPIANAGIDQTITLPSSTVTLSGSGTDPDGTIVSYLWTKVSGPSSGTIAIPSAATTTVNGLGQGTYIFQLLVTDNNGGTGADTVQVIVNPVPNSSPTANAGPDQTIVLPSAVTLVGSGTDTDGTITTFAWTKVSGPAAGTITTPGAATTTVTGLSQGTYVFRLTVTDNNGSTGTDTIQVIAQTVFNPPPVVDAGLDQTITLSAILSGSATDNGTIVSYKWSRVSGPTGVVFSNANSATCIVTKLKLGTYVFKLTATDNQGAISSDTKTLIIN